MDDAQRDRLQRFGRLLQGLLDEETYCRRLAMLISQPQVMGVVASAFAARRKPRLLVDRVVRWTVLLHPEDAGLLQTWALKRGVDLPIRWPDERGGLRRRLVTTLRLVLAQKAVLGGEARDGG